MATVDHAEVSRRIVSFFRKNAGVGHTAAILDGARTTGANVLVVDGSQQRFKNVKGRKQIGFREVLDGQLEGELVQGWPLVLDNEAVVALLSALLSPPKAQSVKGETARPTKQVKGKA